MLPDVNHSCTRVISMIMCSRINSPLQYFKTHITKGKHIRLCTVCIIIKLHHTLCFRLSCKYATGASVAMKHSHKHSIFKESRYLLPFFIITRLFKIWLFHIITVSSIKCTSYNWKISVSYMSCVFKYCIYLYN